MITHFRHRLIRDPTETPSTYRKEKAADNENEGLLLRTKQRAESFDLAFESGTAHFEVVALGPNVLDFGFETAHLVDALLAVTTSGHGVGFALLDAGDFWSEGTVF